MILRIEFVEHKAPRFSWALRLCKKFLSYKEFDDGGQKVHQITFTEKEIDQFRAIHEILYGLRSVAYYVDDQLVPKSEIFRMVSEYETERRMNSWADKQTRDERVRALFHPSPNDAFLTRLKKHGFFGKN